MLDNFIYENHLGIRFNGLENGVYLNTNDLRDYTWSHQSINGRISRFYRSTTSRKLPLVVACESDEVANAVRNKLLEIAEADILARLPGKIYVGEYYTTGYITGSAKTNYLIARRFCNITLTVTSDNPAWYREKTHVFVPTAGNVDFIGETEYPYDYPYDYAAVASGKKLNCDSIGNSAFKLLIYGSATNPEIVIGGHKYAINGTVGSGETLLINSLTKTITLNTTDGRQINWFDKRSRDSYIFEPLPSGKHDVMWVGTFGFNVTVIEERSEPKWT